MHWHSYWKKTFKNHRKMKLLSITFLAIILTQCASTKFDNNAPFTVKSATKLADEKVKIYYTAHSKIDFEHIYFDGRKENIELKNDANGTFIIGNFKNSLLNLKDIQLHSDPLKEYGNTPPKAEEIPFTLKENEVVLSYKVNGETRFYKVDVK